MFFTFKEPYILFSLHTAQMITKLILQNYTGSITFASLCMIKYSLILSKRFCNI